MKTFFCEVHIGNTDKDYAYEIQAYDLGEAVRLINMFSLGADRYGAVSVELRGVTTNRRRGVKYERLG